MGRSEYQRYELGEDLLGVGWSGQFKEELTKDYVGELLAFVDDERRDHAVYPAPSQTFAAFEHTPYDAVRVVILGQDPYPNPGQAHGLAFSVPIGVDAPPSLRNIHAELTSDLGVPTPRHGNLEAWAEQGVLLLNTALTLRAGTNEDHKAHRTWRRRERKGWEAFTDTTIEAVDSKNDPVVFLLWGADARRKARLIKNPLHKIIESSHPSPLSAYRGFLGHRPFSRTNQFLNDRDRGEIDWAAITHPLT